MNTIDGVERKYLNKESVTTRKVSLGDYLQNIDATMSNITSGGQIKAIRVLTQVEYDALPSSKETDYTLYLIRG